MDLLKWEKRYELGMRQFDEHHQHLVALINELHRCSLDDSSCQALEKVTDQLVRYTDYHFSAEEAAMERAAYPGLDEHRAEHRKFTEMALAFQQEFHTGHDIVVDLLSFLGNWLFDHILETDAAYCEKLRTLPKE
jgi:hemerythrin